MGIKKRSKFNVEWELRHFVVVTCGGLDEESTGGEAISVAVPILTNTEKLSANDMLVLEVDPKPKATTEKAQTWYHKSKSEGAKQMKREKEDQGTDADTSGANTKIRKTK